ncbi:hypothetical protein FGIG_06938 [Fasciola gigantica]|uniref:Uncharacterized protein n=1 Tax=Fasciola gigantica TaxID=46835 RepID=A0A504YX04_FASGI|nr:hypothetical protein FGIG_06938 [Fasciola gigantica]
MQNNSEQPCPGSRFGIHSAKFYDEVSDLYSKIHKCRERRLKLLKDYSNLLCPIDRRLLVSSKSDKTVRFYLRQIDDLQQRLGHSEKRLLEVRAKIIANKLWQNGQLDGLAFSEYERSPLTKNVGKLWETGTFHESIKRTISAASSHASSAGVDYEDSQSVNPQTTIQVAEAERSNPVPMGRTEKGSQENIGYVDRPQSDTDAETPTSVPQTDSSFSTTVFPIPAPSSAPVMNYESFMRKAARADLSDATHSDGQEIEMSEIPLGIQNPKRATDRSGQKQCTTVEQTMPNTQKNEDCEEDSFYD